MRFWSRSATGRRVVRGCAAAAVVLGLAADAGEAAGATIAAPTGERADRAAFLDVSHDVVVERAFVPSAQRPQGEVRIVRRGGRVVVQTLLYTRVLKRVLAAIHEKERRNWPSGVPGHTDMERYVAALEEFRRGAAGSPERVGADVDPRVLALIEFVDAPGTPFVAIGGFHIEGKDEAIRVRGRAAPVVLDLSAAYVRRNMRLIVADAFRLSAEEAATRLAKAAGL